VGGRRERKRERRGVEEDSAGCRIIDPHRWRVIGLQEVASSSPSPRPPTPPFLSRLSPSLLLLLIFFFSLLYNEAVSESTSSSPQCSS